MPHQFPHLYRAQLQGKGVLQLIAEGMATAEIAKHLFVSIKTIEFHRSAIFRKLKINSIAKLTKFAFREGITPP